MQQEVSDICFQGFPLATILEQIHDKVIFGEQQFNDLDKAMICEKIAQVDQSLIDGANEELQLLDLAALIRRRFTKEAPAFIDYPSKY